MTENRVNFEEHIRHHIQSWNHTYDKQEALTHWVYLIKNKLIKKHFFFEHNIGNAQDKLYMNKVIPWMV